MVNTSVSRLLVCGCLRWCINVACVSHQKINTSSACPPQKQSLEQQKFSVTVAIPISKVKCIDCMCIHSSAFR